MKNLSIRFSTFLILTLTSFSSYAEDQPHSDGAWDLETFAGFRSYPLGAGLGVEGGYSDYLWGQKSSDPLSWGYLRIGGMFQTSGVVNKG